MITIRFIGWSRSEHSETNIHRNPTNSGKIESFRPPQNRCTSFNGIQFFHVRWTPLPLPETLLISIPTKKTRLQRTKRLRMASSPISPIFWMFLKDGGIPKSTHCFQYEKSWSSMTTVELPPAIPWLRLSAPFRDPRPIHPRRYRWRGSPWQPTPGVVGSWGLPSLGFQKSLW